MDDRPEALPNITFKITGSFEGNTIEQWWFLNKIK